MWAIVVVLKSVVAALAWRLARGRMAHLPIAVLLAAGVVADVVRRALALFVLGPVRATTGGAPFGGAARAAFHLEQGLFLLWPAGLAALSLVVLGRRRAWPIIGGHAAATVALALAYPTVRGPLLSRVYLGLELVALATVFGAGLAWWARREEPSITEGSVLVLAFLELGALIAYRQPFGSGWDWAQVIYLMAFATLGVLHVGELWTSSRPHPSP